MDIFAKRLSLYEDTVACKKTADILTAPFIMYLPIKMYNEVTIGEVMMDYEKIAPSMEKYMKEFEPDLYWGPESIFPGPALDILGCNYINWPGKSLGMNEPFQVALNPDGYMEGEEYLEYAEDPTGFIMRKVLPRQFDSLKGLEMLNFSNAVWQGGLYSMIPASLPPVIEAFEKMTEAGKKMIKMAEASASLAKHMAELGWPSAVDRFATVPFDVFNDTLRGLINTSMDMLEYPDELLAALETSTKIQVREVKEMFKANPQIKTIGMFIHNGMDSFMSREQFQTFYWPGFKAVVEAIVECGGIPYIFLEDCYNSKMDILANELPPNKCIVTPINSDLEKTKDLFAGKVCISGGINGVLLQYGSKEDVIADVKNKLDILAPGGGYFASCDVNLDDAKPENLHALFDTVRNYAI